MRGVWTALVTPFVSQGPEKGQIDWPAFERIVEGQKAAGIHGIIPCGTTGESPTLSQEEKKALIRKSIELCRGSSTLVVAGTGSNQTEDTVNFSRWASEQGVSGVLVVTPYYNKPSAAGLLAHFTAVAEAVSCPVVLYNVPGRTGTSLSIETIVKLMEHPRIPFLKEATGNVELTSQILDAVEGAGKKIGILSGDDATYLPLLSVGAVGVISVASNLFPAEMVELQKKWDSGDAKGALAIHRRFYPLFRDLFVESNPGPIKAAMAWIGACEETLRPPLVGLTAESRKKLERSLEACGIPRKKK